jgi:hypothetical protein
MITTAIFIWFIITTKCPAPIMITVLLLLLTAYLVGQNAQHDPEYIEKKGISRKIQTGLSISALVLSIIGFGIYIVRHRSEFGSPNGFFSGTLKCTQQ